MPNLGLRRKLANARQEVSYFFNNKLIRPNLFNLATAERIGAVYREPTDMCETDRLMLYALVRGLRPRGAIEIGVRWGGSARIITNAMQENGVGKLIGVDPAPEAFRVKEKELHGRYHLLKGFSPQAIPDAVAKLEGTQLDLVFIDALHTYDAVLQDSRACLPYLDNGSHILFHDTYHQGINKAIDQLVEESSHLTDLGFLTRNPETLVPVAYQGLRLVRVGEAESQEIISEGYRRSQIEPPIFHDAIRNYDAYANRIGKGATVDEIALLEEKNVIKPKR